MAKSYKVTVFAGTKIVADMAQQVKNATIDASLELKPIAGGATEATAVLLAPPDPLPINSNRKRTKAVGWYKNATGPAWEAPRDYDNTNWWSFETGLWSLGSSSPYPKPELVNSLNSQDDSKAMAASQGPIISKKIGKSDILPIGTNEDRMIVKIGGIVESTTFSYAVLTYDVKSGQSYKFHINLVGGITPGTYAIASLWNDAVWVKDILISTAETLYDLQFVAPSGVNKLKLISGRSVTSEATVVSLGLSQPFVLKGGLDIDTVGSSQLQSESVTFSKVNPRTKVELSGVRSILSYSSRMLKKLMRPNGVIEDTTFSYNIYVFTVKEKSEIDIKNALSGSMSAGFIIASFYKDDMWVSDLVPSVSSQLDYNFAAKVPKGVNKLYIISNDASFVNTIVSSTSVIEDQEFAAVETNSKSMVPMVLGKVAKGVEFSKSAGVIQKVGFYRDNGTFADTSSSNPTWRCLLFKLYPNAEYVWSIPACVTNSCSVVFDKSMNVLMAFKADAADTFAEPQELIAPAGAAFFATVAFTTANAGTFTLKNVNDITGDTVEKRISELEAQAVTVPDLFSTYLPPTVYGMIYNENTVNFLNRLYIEGISSVKNKDLKINNRPNLILDMVSTTAGSSNLSYTLSAKGFKDAVKTLAYRRVLISAGQGRMIRFMAIGDSLTAGGYPSIMEYIAKCYNADLGNINYLSIGTMVQNLTISLGGREFTNKGACEGRGGWSVSDYLRHICQTRARNGSNNSSTIVGKAAWDSLGLGTMTRNGLAQREYQTFVYSESSGDLVRTTCHGYYDADPTPELWDWICNSRSMKGKSFTFNSIVYTFGNTYSAGDDAAQVAYIKYCCSGNIINGLNLNPFYDSETVESSQGAYAYNFSKYIDKYKTIDSNGNRLTVGSTAGTLITSAQINEFDVCLPTHLALIMNNNDINNITDGTLIANDMLLLGDLIGNAYPSIKIAIGSTRGYGAFDPNSYADLGLVNETGVDTTRLNCTLSLMEKIATTHSYFSFLPIYFIQSVFGTKNGKAYDTMDLKEKIRYNGDTLHTLYPLGYLDRAYQILCWVWSTFI